MANWQDPVNLQLEFFGVVKLVHFVLGAFTWEILSTLYFDWQVFTGKRMFKWPFLLYIGCRFFTFSFLVSSAVGNNITTRFNCQVWITLVFSVGYTGVALASGLLALRTIAFWSNNKIVIILAFALWLFHIAFLIYGITQAHSFWNPETNACVASNTENNLQNILVTLSTDLALLIIMLSGIWRSRKAGALWQMVYRQGMWWVVGATVGELPAIILTGVDLNDAMNLLLQPVAVLAMTLCATRMYRELCEYAKPVISTQDLSIDISPLKSNIQPPSRPTLSLGLTTATVGEELGRQSSNNMELDLPFDHSHKPVDI